jgi:hypothetical protein
MRYHYDGAVVLALAALVLGGAGCGKKAAKEEAVAEMPFKHMAVDSLKAEIARFAPVDITYDETILSRSEKDALAKLVQVSHLMDEIFLRQVWEGNVAMRNQLVKAAETPGPNQALAQDLYRFFRINAGPWLRLEGGTPFIGTIRKPDGAGYYPPDMTKQEFESFIAAHPDTKDTFTGYFTRIERTPDGTLKAVSYNEAYGDILQSAARLMNEAADILTSDQAKAELGKGVDYTTLATFLRSRAAAFLSNDYLQSDMDWMDIRDNIIDVTIGPYEVYEDGLFNYKAAFEAVIAIRNPSDSKKLEQLKSFLPAMEKNLPIPAQYKNPRRGTESPVAVIDVVHAAGDIKAGVHAVAYNLPNDERVREAKGSKKVMLKNITRAKYEKILVPIANVVLDPAQMERVDFESFFTQSLVHELAHGLGPGTIKLPDGTTTTVNQALKTLYSPLEECKADVVGLHNHQYLLKQGVITKEQLDRQYVVFLPGLFRSVRFGLHEAHAKGNIIQYNWFKDKGAFVLDPVTDHYTVNFEKMGEAAMTLTHEILMLQAKGDYAAAEAFVSQWGNAPPEVERIVGKLSGIPSDVAPDYDAREFSTAGG